ncbi:hypothetical protein HNP11_003215 [Tsukamurella ocularis]|nr:hypothetical protein [Tsukamurella ocularis]MCS3789025.1 hypothetical protein [Tsukamurella ocularis]MCS3850235.1 hypothetical protein [Tsukamurella ocularis]
MEERRRSSSWVRANRTGVAASSLECHIAETRSGTPREHGQARSPLSVIRRCPAAACCRSNSAQPTRWSRRPSAHRPGRARPWDAERERLAAAGLLSATGGRRGGVDEQRGLPRQVAASTISRDAFEGQTAAVRRSCATRHGAVTSDPWVCRQPVKTRLYRAGRPDLTERRPWAPIATRACSVSFGLRLYSDGVRRAVSRRFESCQRDVLPSAYALVVVACVDYVPNIALQSALFRAWIHALITWWTRWSTRLSAERWGIFG